ncbi:MAG: heavy metal-associated protein [Bacteroidetes bacterium]|nr:MAG: heavy metal-associated protein [Bacteroidota bacterium]
MIEKKFKTNINCNNCLNSVTPFLNQEMDIEEWQVDLSHPDRILSASLEEDDANVVIQAIEKAGFKAELIED